MNKQTLNKRIAYLEEIIKGIIEAWKLKHPEDFILSEDSKLVKYEGNSPESPSEKEKK